MNESEKSQEDKSNFDSLDLDHLDNKLKPEVSSTADSIKKLVGRRKQQTPIRILSEEGENIIGQTETSHGINGMGDLRSDLATELDEPKMIHQMKWESNDPLNESRSDLVKSAGIVVTNGDLINSNIDPSTRETDLTTERDHTRVEGWNASSGVTARFKSSSVTIGKDFEPTCEDVVADATIHPTTNYNTSEIRKNQGEIDSYVYETSRETTLTDSESLVQSHWNGKEGNLNISEGNQENRLFLKLYPKESPDVDYTRSATSCCSSIRSHTSSKECEEMSNEHFSVGNIRDGESDILENSFSEPVSKVSAFRLLQQNFSGSEGLVGLSSGDKNSRGCRSSQSPTPNSSSKTSSDSFNGKSMPIFHQDAYCKLCEREFCNKYFLRTHMANKHGVFEQDLIDHSDKYGFVSKSGNAGNLFSTGVIKDFKQNSFSLSSYNSDFIAMKDRFNSSIFGNTFDARNPFFSSSSVLDLSKVVQDNGNEISATSRKNAPLGGTDNTDFNIDSIREDKSEEKYSKSEHLNEYLTKTSTSIDNDSLSVSISSSSSSMEDYCNLCKRHFCNKYYLKKHKTDVHGLPASSMAGLNFPGSPISSAAPFPFFANPAVQSFPFCFPTVNPLLINSLPKAQEIQKGYFASFASDRQPLNYLSLLQPQSWTGATERLAKDFNSYPSSLFSAFPTFSMPGPNNDLRGLFMNMDASVQAQCATSEKLSYPSREAPKRGELPESLKAQDSNSDIHQLNSEEAKDSHDIAGERNLEEMAEEREKESASPAPDSGRRSITLEANDFRRKMVEGHPLGQLQQDYLNRFAKFEEISFEKIWSNVKESLHRARYLGYSSGSSYSGIYPTLAGNGALTSPLLERSPLMQGQVLNGKTSEVEDTDEAGMFERMLSAKLADRVTCDICDKQLCNKYFLKTHKYKVHGISLAEQQQQQQQQLKRSDSAASCPQRSGVLDDIPLNFSKLQENDKMQSNKFSLQNGIARSASYQEGHLTAKPDFNENPIFRNGINQNSKLPVSRSDNMNIQKLPNPFSAFPSYQPFSMNLFSQNIPRPYFPVLNSPMLFNPSDRKDIGSVDLSLKGSPSSTSSSSSFALPPKTSNNFARVMCQLCQKVLCNKYFLRTHMEKRHGINRDLLPLGAAMELPLQTVAGEELSSVIENRNQGYPGAPANSSNYQRRSVETSVEIPTNTSTTNGVVYDKARQSGDEIFFMENICRNISCGNDNCSIQNDMTTSAKRNTKLSDREIYDEVETDFEEGLHKDQVQTNKIKEETVNCTGVDQMQQQNQATVRLSERDMDEKSTNALKRFADSSDKCLNFSQDKNNVKIYELDEPQKKLSKLDLVPEYHQKERNNSLASDAYEETSTLSHRREPITSNNDEDKGICNIRSYSRDPTVNSEMKINSYADKVTDTIGNLETSDNNPHSDSFPKCSLDAYAANMNTKETINNRLLSEKTNHLSALCGSEESSEIGKGDLVLSDDTETRQELKEKLSKNRNVAMQDSENSNVKGGTKANEEKLQFQTFLIRQADIGLKENFLPSFVSLPTFRHLTGAISVTFDLTPFQALDL